MMEVSIIVPVYNVAPYIEQCIRSVMAQTFDGSMECLIIDDCGTDESMVIVERIIRDYKGPIQFNILHHYCNRGLSAARNTGIEHAKGNYIYFLDSDDWITDFCIELLMSKVKENPSIELVQGCYYLVFANETRHQHYIPRNEVFINTNENVRHYFFNPTFVNVHAWNKLIKRSLITNNVVLFKEGIIYEDYLWGFYLIKHLSTVILLSGITYYYRSRPQSITQSSTTNKGAESLRIIYSDFLKNLTPGHERQELIYITRKMTLDYTKFVHVMPAYKDLMMEYEEKALVYKAWSTFLKLKGAQLLSNFGNGYKIVYWLKIQKKNVDDFILNMRKTFIKK